MKHDEDYLFLYLFTAAMNKHPGKEILPLHNSDCKSLHDSFVIDAEMNFAKLDYALADDHTGYAIACNVDTLEIWEEE